MRSSSFLLGFQYVLMISILPAGDNWQAKATSDPQIDSPPFTRHQIEDHIIMAERQINDIRPGLEKSIIWAGKPHHRTRYAIVYIHGFYASSEELRPVPDRVAAALGANLYFTRLTGHGRGPSAMGEADVGRWMQDLGEALAIGRSIGEKVLIISTSTGAAEVTAPR